MDFQNAVAPPTNYGAPNVFAAQPNQQAQPGQQNGQPGGSQISALLAKAKQMMSSGLISSDQYNQIAQQAAASGNSALPYSGGNMGASMPGGAQPSSPLNIMPGQGG